MTKRKKNKLCRCTVCGIVLKESMMIEHALHSCKSPLAKSVIPLSSNRKSPAAEDSIAMKVMNGIQNGEKWIANLSEQCESCRKPVIYLSTGEGTRKAFDVGRDRIILGTHSCEDEAPSESIYAYSGGIIDSNRRRH